MSAFTLDWFDAVYRGEGPLDFPPWDVGVPQPAFVRLYERGELRYGRVLDAGCGTGDLALYLAGHVVEVVGCDLSPAAVDQARRKAASRALPVRFEVADLTALTRFAGWFDAVVDCGALHVLDAPDRGRYLRSLHELTLRDATLHVLALSADAPRFGPEGLSPETLTAELAAAGWQVRDLDRETLLERVPNETVGRVLRASPGDLVEVPAWLATATRRPAEQR
ncbi:class I SAM-dependent methyltransferase [Micromonospora sp. NPDC050495]|uniref:class I SAM-dependent methyltransferase n=1 Tax=Micromonospora sp. NPDC050495 TaxID=3154936 RepID=UPI0033F6D69A